MSGDDQFVVSRDFLESFLDTDDCWFDHHGGCQGHGYLDLEPGEKCPQRELQELLAELAQVPTPITAADVRAAEKAWQKKRRGEAWPWVENLSLDHDTFMAEHLNRRGAGPDDRTEPKGAV